LRWRCRQGRRFWRDSLKLNSLVIGAVAGCLATVPVLRLVRELAEEKKRRLPPGRATGEVREELEAATNGVGELATTLGRFAYVAAAGSL
jgi:hypothetical protein